MSFTPLAFTGISTFSADFQTVLTRAVSIATLPLKALQNQDADILQQKGLLGSLSGAVEALGTSVASLGTIAHNRALAATSSDSATVSVVNSGATSAATYTISDITSVAKPASETSAIGYADSTLATVSSTGTIKLVIGATEKTIVLTPATNNLAGLRDAINALGVGVTASILTTGTGATPNYLTVSSNASGETTLQLIDDPTPGANTNLLTAANQGANTSFKLNGVTVSKPTSTINDVVSGATFTILKTTAPAATVTLSLSSNRSSLQSAIQDFASKYNSLVDQVGGQIGPSAGLLSGDFIVRELQNDLHQLSGYQGTGSVKNLSDLGIQLDAQGKIKLDATIFQSLSDSTIESAFDFFGAPKTGFGALASKFNEISDPISGLIKLQTINYEQADARIQNSIADLNDRITDLQTRVTLQLQAADALQAHLTAQQTVLTASLASLTFTSFGKQAN